MRSTAVHAPGTFLRMSEATGNMQSSDNAFARIAPALERRQQNVASDSGLRTFIVSSHIVNEHLSCFDTASILASYISFGQPFGRSLLLSMSTLHFDRELAAR
eukprot:TRINITY_DN36432_c0_g2_i3.p1 TRINITY_DN36432_c0_g2~~TRINITY_DN36432_c0_g2_i3.p1  ORF type:complete len:103 (-),score=4.12 TRINITY_DN36432_c0_g2_i3:317-625(-)